ncbi:MAG TPA: hypothetical protein PLQ93_13575 [Bacteroidia bacterium]|nr:hypothetical protein [Bacteroidia bacterium]
MKLPDSINIRLIFASALCIMLSSCIHYVYIPNSVNVPLLKEKNELHLSGIMGTGEYISTTEAQASYAITKELGLMGSYMQARGGTSTDGGKGQYGDLALGYFKPFKNDIVLEIYGGAGTSNQNHWFNQLNTVYTIRFNKYFIQPSFGYSLKNFEFAFSTRFSFLDFKPDSSIVPLYNIAVPDNKTILLYEPALTLRAGWKYIKLQLQFVMAYPANGARLSMEQGNANLGLYFSLARRYHRSN